MPDEPTIKMPVIAPTVTMPVTPPEEAPTVHMPVTPPPVGGNPFAPGVLVWDNQTGQPTYIRTQDYAQAVASGRFKPYEGSVITTDREGVPVTADPALGLQNLGAGEGFVSPMSAEQAARRAAQEEAFDNLGDKAFTFGEGVASTLSFGALRERGEIAEDRRRTLSKSAAAGALVGTGLAFLAPTGPVGKLAKATSEAGEAAAGALLAERMGESGARAIARRAISEGVQGGLFTTAYGAGNAAMDAIIENKPFAAEHLAAAAGTDIAMGVGFGAGFGALGQMFKGARSSIRAREWITAQGGILDAASSESASVNRAVGEALGGWDDALEKHRAVSDNLDPAIRGGELGAGGEQWSADRRQLIREADALRRQIDQIDIPKALASDDISVHNKLLGYRRGEEFVPGLLDRYADTVGKLDGYGPTASMEEWAAQRRRYADISAQVDEFEDGLWAKADDADNSPMRADEAPLSRMDDSATPGEGTNAGTPKAKRSGGKRGGPDDQQQQDTPKQGGDLAAPKQGRDLAAPRIDPASSRSPLAAFARDVQAVAANLSNPSIDDIWFAMRKGGGKAPVQHKGPVPVVAGKPMYTPERIRELIAEAEHAGYLRTTGPRTYEVPHMGMSIGNAVEVPKDITPGDIKWSKKERFPWEDRGKRAGEYKAKDGTWKPVATTVDPNVPTGAPDGGAIPPSASASAGTPGLSMPGGPNADFVRSTAALEDFAQPRAPRPIEPYGAKASQRVTELLDEIHRVTDGRVGKMAAMDAAESHGIAPGPRGALTEALVGVVGLRRLAADLANSVRTGTTPAKSALLRRMGIRAGMSAARQSVMGGNVLKGATAAASGTLAGHLIMSMFGMVGATASHLGHVKEMVIKAGAAVLAGKGSRVAAAAIPMVARYGYGDAEPTEDVVERVQQLQSAVANPDRLTEIVRGKLGDLAIADPALADAAAQEHVRMLTNLSMKAPKFVWDALGRPRVLGQQALRQFREAEDATWDFEGLMERIGNGSVTRTQGEMFRAQFPLAHAEFVNQILSDPDALQRASRETRAAIERAAGVPLTHLNAEYAQRQQAAFQAPEQSQPAPNLNLTVPPPTPAQAAMAPGNH